MTNKPTSFVKGNLKLIQWTNEDKDKNSFESYQIEKFYKSDDEWKTSNIFSAQELVNIALLILEFNQKVKPIVVKQPNENKVETEKVETEKV
jgi:hypothetical protein